MVLRARVRYSLCVAFFGILAQLVLVSQGQAQPATPPSSPHSETTPATDQYSEGVGFLGAQFHVDESGAANYTIPIVLPPGTAGVQPEVMLSYNSRSPNGPLGRGWSVGGQSSITRCKKSTEHGDGQGPFAGVNFDEEASNDAYCIDGQRLLPITSGTDSTLCPTSLGFNRLSYRLELDTATRVCAYNFSDKIGVSHWVVLPRDGSLRRYGYRSDSALRPNNGTTPLTDVFATWALDATVDATGNAIYYEYEESEDLGELHLRYVRYGARVNRANVALSQTAAPYAWVEFVYEAMPAVAQRQDWIDGSRFTLTKRLQKIEVSGPINNGASPNNASLIRRYHLGYRDSTTGSRFSRLETVKECGFNSAGEVCQPSTRFEWLGSGAGHQAPPQGFGTVSQGSYPEVFRRNADHKLGDINGDGRQDMVWIEDRHCSGGGVSDPQSTQRFRFHVSTVRTNGSVHELGTPQQTSLYLERDDQPGCNTSQARYLGTLWFLYDFTGDGRDDLLLPTGGSANGTWKVFPSISAGSGQWTFSTNTSQILDTGIKGRPSDDAYFADFTGDGLPDLFSPHGGAGQFQLAVRSMQRAPTGALYAFQFTATSVIVNFVGVPEPGCIGFASGSISHDRQHSSQAGDINSDGRADVLIRYQERCENFREGEGFAFVPISEPEGGIAVQNLWYVFRTVGLDAQNRLTMQSHQFVGQSEPTSQEPQPLVYGPQAVQILDINGDGQSDLLIQRASGSTRDFRYRLGNGRSSANVGFSTENSTGLSLSSDASRWVVPIDVNGDQRVDLLYVDASSQHTLRARLFDRNGFTAVADAAVGTTLNSQDPAQHATFFIDFDGNGAPDILRFHGQSNTLYRSIAVQAFGGSDFITRIDNALGARTLIRYGLLTNASLYQRYNDGPRKNWGRNSPVFDVFAPLWAVREASSSSPTEIAPNGFATVRYKYAGARIQSGGRGFLGFAWVYSEDTHNRIGTSTEYRQDFPFVGRPARTMAELLPAAPPIDPCIENPTLPSCFVEPPPNCAPFPCQPQGVEDSPFRGTGAVISDATSTWQSQPSWQSPPSVQQATLVWLANSNELKNELNGAASYRIVSTFLVDKYGNPRSTEVVHYTGASEQRGAVAQTKGVEHFYGCTSVPITVANCAYLTPDPPSGSNWDDERVRLGRLSLSGIVTDRTFDGNRNDRRVSYEYDVNTLQLIAEIQGPYSDIEFDIDKRKRMELRTDYVLDNFGNRTLAVQCSIFHYADRDTCLTLSGFQQRQWETDPTRVQRYVRTEYDIRGRFPLRTRKPYYSATAGGNLNEQYSEQVGVTATGALAMTPLGEPLRVVDANGVATELFYDAFGRERFRRQVTGSFLRTAHRWCQDTSHTEIPPLAPRVACPLGAVYRTESSSQATSGLVNGQHVSPMAFTYFDSLGREVLRTTEMFKGSNPARLWSSVATYYDVLGRTFEQTVPYFSHDPIASQSATRPGAPQSGGAPARTKTDHDELSRVVSIEQPEQPANGLNEALFDYDRLTTDMFYPKHTAQQPQIATTLKNPMGEILSYTDRGGLQVQYGYDAVGNVRTINRAPASGPLNGQAILTQAEYDRHGRRISIDDPDKGGWSYKYNALGELVEQTDARGLVQRLYYDALGRVFKRTQDDPGTIGGVATATWTFDIALRGSTGQRALGLLDSEQQTTYVPLARAHSYDSYGRPVGIQTSIDFDTFYQRVTYDAFGRVFQQFDASLLQNSPYGSLIQYSVEGYVVRVREAANGVSGVAYRETLTVDARGNVVLERLGGRSDLETTRNYDSNTGRLTSITTGINGALQAWTYGWDKHSNLTFRWNQATGYGGEGTYDIKEDFNYDHLDRLTAVRLTRFNGVATNQTSLSLSYDPLGNILTKSGIGTYSYSNETAQHSQCSTSAVAGPHAVRQAGSKQYCYDASGNQTSTWLSGQRIRNIVTNGFGLVETIERIEPANGIDQAFERFVYGPDNARWARMSVLNTPNIGEQIITWYIGNIEYIKNADPVLKRYIAGVAVVSHQQDGLGNTLDIKTEYLLKDHLGSVDVVVPIVTNSIGTIQRLSFNAHGQRRHASPAGSGTLWSLLGISEAAAFNTSSTTRGFTGHEQLDGTGLVHMNGRVYDPELGRFIQADNLIDPGDISQGLNRYSYVLNNPLTRVDPSGSLSIRQIAGIVIGAVAIWISGGMLAGTFAPIMGLSATASAFTVAVAGGFVAGAISTGSIEGGLWGAFSAAITFGVASAFSPGTPGYVVGNGAAGGVLTELQGGKFGHGFVAAAASAAINPAIKDLSIGTRIAIRAAVGGSVSKVTGGNFANGASAAAFQAMTEQVVASSAVALSEKGTKTPHNILDPDNHRFEKNQGLARQISMRERNGVVYISSLIKVRNEGPFWFPDYFVDDINLMINGDYYVGGQWVDVDFQFEFVTGKADIVLYQDNRYAGWTNKSGLLFREDPIYLNSATNRGTAAHEFGHVLGFGHAWHSTNDIMSYNQYHRWTTPNFVETLLRNYGPRR